MIPDRDALLREVRSLEQMGFPRFTAQRAVLEKYRLPRFPDIHTTPSQTRGARGVEVILELYRWPRTKAAWVRAMYWRNLPTLPLLEEIVQAIPPDLPGPLPIQIEDLAFGRPVRLGLENIRAVENAITSADAESLRTQRRACTAGGRAHFWIPFPTLSYARRPEWYCAHCLIVKLAGFQDWPITSTEKTVRSELPVPTTPPTGG